MTGRHSASDKLYTAVRSLLAVPASNLKMAGKALASEADAVFLDLEDAVAPDEKAGAREKIVQALRELDWRGPQGRVRSASTARW